MKKSIYSLALSENVIRAVDEAAYKCGMSRSAMINRILAEKLECDTPEMRMEEISDSMEAILGDIVQVERQRSAILLVVKSVLEYKYRPTISYKLELERVPDEYIGTLRVGIRTRSERLIDLFNSFFLYWIKFEKGRYAQMGRACPACELSSGRYSRRLYKPADIIVEDDGSAIGEYIRALDRAVKAFFADPSGFGAVAPELEERTAQTLSLYRI